MYKCIESTNKLFTNEQLYDIMLVENEFGKYAIENDANRLSYGTFDLLDEINFLGCRFEIVKEIEVAE